MWADQTILGKKKKKEQWKNMHQSISLCQAEMSPYDKGLEKLTW